MGKKLFQKQTFETSKFGTQMLFATLCLISPPLEYERSANNLGLKFKLSNLKKSYGFKFKLSNLKQLWLEIQTLKFEKVMALNS